MNRYSEEMKFWLFDLAHGMLDDTQILKGFLKHYVLHGFVIDNIYDDILHHTTYGMDGIKKARESVERSIIGFIGEIN